MLTDIDNLIIIIIFTATRYLNVHKRLLSLSLCIEQEKKRRKEKRNRKQEIEMTDLRPIA